MNLGKRWSVRILWEPRDLWVGVYWNRDRHSGFITDVLSIYVCVVPCLPIQLVREVTALDPLNARAGAR